jgi:Flp pilus assembly protein TadG
MARLRQAKAIRLLSRFCADRSGATAVEFALVAFPFITLLFAIMQTALVMFGNLALQTLIDDSSRSIMVGQMNGKAFDAFKAKLCGGRMSVMFDCDKLLVQVQSFSSFGEAADAELPDSKCFPDDKDDPEPKAEDCWKAGAGKSVVVVLVSYDWPFAIDLEDLDHKTRITAVTAFRNEPF